MIVRSVFLVGMMLILACEDDAAKKEAERLRGELEAVKAEKAKTEAEKVKADADAARKENEQLRAELDATKVEKARAAKENARAGRVIVNEVADLKEGRAQEWKVPQGRHRVRVTASNSGVKVKWIGVECAPAKETKLYDVECDVSSPSGAFLAVENPKGLTGLGPTETVSVTATTM